MTTAKQLRDELKEFAAIAGLSDEAVYNLTLSTMEQLDEIERKFQRHEVSDAELKQLMSVCV